MHRYEQLADILEARYHSYVEELVKHLSVDGRPMFNVKLSDDEQLDRWLIPSLRQETMQGIMQEEGEAALKRYIKRMQEMEVKRSD